MGETIKFIDINGENHPIEADLLDGLHASSFALVTDLANYYTKSQTYSQSEIDNLIGAITEFEAVVTTELPTASESTMKKIYLIPSAGEGQNSKDEYITWLDGDVYKWEKIGSTDISLDGYATEDYVDEEIEDLATHKQDTLVSGTNIKTINGESILGEGDLTVLPLIEITHSSLKALRDNGELTPGMQYRITDYVTTTSFENTTSAGHAFDIIVVADSEDTLNENSRAIQHDGDTYFANSDINSWKLKYCIDNDESRFTWAADNGKGVIYYMKDEFRNECYYDFSNILFNGKYTFNYQNNDARYVRGSLVHDNIINIHYDGYTSSDGGSGTYIQSLNNIVLESTSSSIMLYYNYFGNDCYNISISGTYFIKNYFEGCDFDLSLTGLGVYSTIESYVYSCDFNSLGVSRIGRNCQFLSVSKTSGSYAYCNILPGTKGTSTSSRLSINATNPNSKTIIDYGKNTSGTLKSWNPADVVTYTSQSLTTAQKTQARTNIGAGTVTGIKINGTTKSPTSGVVDIGTVLTSHQSLSNYPTTSQMNSAISTAMSDMETMTHAAETYQPKGSYLTSESDPVFLASVAATIDANNISEWNGKQEELVSGTNIKTINGESILGSGDIAIKPMVETTYSALKALRDFGDLVPGTQYHITDYVTTTVQANTQSAGHVFDIIVTADSENTLNENARAILHDGDTYFSNYDLNAWQLKYCIDNDDTRFVWADTSNGKGVVYYMKDEFNNECPYDFKNIQFMIGAKSNAGTLDDVYYYTFSIANDMGDMTIIDHSLNGAYCYGNSFKECISSNKRSLNFIVCRNISITDYCYGNSTETNCYNIACGSNCYNWSCGNDCYEWSCGSSCSYWTCGNDCTEWSCGSFCDSWTCGNGCFMWSCGNRCTFWSCGNYCYGWSCGNYCQEWSCGNTCSNWRFGNSSASKNYYRHIMIDDGCSLFYLNTNKATSSSNYVQNIHICQGITGTSSARKTITIGTVNNNYTIRVENDSNGNMHIYNLPDELNGGDGMVFTIYSELMDMRDRGGLIPGTYYRITDYVTTTDAENTLSAGNVFDVIVKADNPNALNENAYAALHSGDTYFANSKLEAWRLKYCLDNDKDRFDWADRRDGKGVIYYMKDEFNNECPYDFKNIQFMVGANNIAGTKDRVYYYTFSVVTGINDEIVSDHSLNGSHCYDNSFKEYINSSRILNFIVCRNISITDDCYGNSAGVNCYNISCGNSCYGWTCGNNCPNWTCGEGCYRWTCGNNCYGWTCGVNCSNWTCGNDCLRWTCGNNCYDWSCGNYCSNLSCGNGCYGWSCGNNCSEWSCGNNCYGWSCGNDCHGWSFGSSTDLKSYYRYIMIDDGCSYFYLDTIQTTSDSNYVQNIHICQGFRGIDSSSYRKTITIDTVNNDYTIRVENDSNGNMLIYNLPDEIQGAVKYDSSQSLTSAQKSQACSNIGAVSTDNFITDGLYMRKNSAWAAVTKADLLTILGGTVETWTFTDDNNVQYVKDIIVLN